MTGAPDKRRLRRFTTEVLKLFAQLGRPLKLCGEGAEPRSPAWPRPALRAPAGVEPAPGAALACGSLASPCNLWHRPRLGHARASDWVPGSDHALPPLRVGDRRESGAGARAGEWRGQLVRRERRTVNAASRAREDERAAQGSREPTPAPQVRVARDAASGARSFVLRTLSKRPLDAVPPAPGSS